MTMIRTDILFRDARFIVLNKPAGLKVHAGPGGGPSVEDWFPALSPRRDGPWLAHRLDADTAGCLLIALRKAALLAAQTEFAANRVSKIYWAVVEGAPTDMAGLLTLNLSRETNPAGWRMRPDPAGLTAATAWRVLGRSGGLSWLELQPRTGRTHQLRVHCAALGCPILGDAVYGTGGRPMHLLARSIAMPLQPPVAATAPPPEFMRHTMSQNRWEPKPVGAKTGGSQYRWGVS